MVSRKTSLKLIETAIKESWIRQLAFYHLLKFKFNNSCFYNYKSRMKVIADQLNISEKTLYNYLNFLRSKDLVYDHSGNLILKSIRPFLGRSKTVIYLDDSFSLWDVSCCLYAKIMEQRASQIAFKESVRKFGRADRDKRELSGKPYHISLSYRNIAKLLNVSEFKAFKIVQNLNRLNVLRSLKQPPELIARGFTAIYSVSDYPGYLFNIEDRLFRQFGNKIDFVQFPIYQKRITLKQYLKNIDP
jgi:hypothetical protein